VALDVAHHDSLLLLRKLLHTREDLALEELETGTSTSGHVRELILGVVLGHDSRGVATAHDDNGTLGGGLNSGVEEGLGASGEVVEFEDTRRAGRWG
jgi:hypothetical protein